MIFVTKQKMARGVIMLFEIKLTLFSQKLTNEPINANSII